MFRLRSKSGEESIFRSPEEIRSALLSGIVTPDAQIWDVVLKGWVPLLEHALYQEIAGTGGGRKSGVVKARPTGSVKASPGSTPTPAKPVPKLVIKRPGEGAAPTPPPPPPPRAPEPQVEEFHDLELLDIDMTVEPVEEAPAPVMETPVSPPPPPKRPTPPPAAPPRVSSPAPAPPVDVPVPAPRSSAPRITAPRAPMAAFDEMTAAQGGSKKWIVIVAVLVLAAAGGGYAVMTGKIGAAAAAPIDTTALIAPAVDTTRADSTAVGDTTRHDSVATPPVAAVDTSHPVVATPAPRDTAPAPGAVAPVPFAPVVARGPTPWNARPVVGLPLSIPSVEVVRLRYLAAQARALQQFEAGLEAASFNDVFDPVHLSTADNRDDAFNAVDQARGALRDFRRRQTSIDFVYTDSLRQALPAGSDEPDLRTFGPLLRETPAQAALSDSLLGEVAEMFGMLQSQAGTYTLRSGMVNWKDPDDADQYRALQERLTAQMARIRTLAAADLPPALAGILRAIGLPR